MMLLVQADPAGAERDTGVEPDPVPAWLAEEVRGEVEVRKRHLAGVGPYGHAVGDVEEPGDPGQVADLLVSDERQRGAYPERRPARLGLLAPDLDGGDEPTRPDGGRIPGRQVFGSGDARQRRGAQAGGVAGPHQPGPQQHRGPAGMAQGGLDELDGAAGAKNSYLDPHHVDRDRAQDVVGEAADDQPIIAAGVAVGLDRMGEQAQRGSDVLEARIPGPADMVGRPEGVLADPLEVGHPCRVEGQASPRRARSRASASSRMASPSASERRSFTYARWVLYGSLRGAAGGVADSRPAG